MRLEEKEEKIEVTQRNPELKQDVTLFKIILMPLELYVLKYLLINLRPTNIREVYTDAIFICFHQLFAPEVLEDPKTSYRFLVPHLMSAGYGYGLVPRIEREKILYQYVKESKGLSETELRKTWLEPIKKYHSRTPSYDKIKGIFNNFERLGIIYKRGKEGKGIVYALNPKFYNQFKDQREKIIKL